MESYIQSVKLGRKGERRMQNKKELEITLVGDNNFVFMLPNPVLKRIKAGTLYEKKMVSGKDGNPVQFTFCSEQTFKRQIQPSLQKIAEQNRQKLEAAARQEAEAKNETSHP